MWQYTVLQMYSEMKHKENKCIETMIYQNLVANVLLDESKGHTSPGVGDLIAIWSHDFGQILMFPLRDELLSLDLNSRYTS